jgi:hypothetical protein
MEIPGTSLPARGGDNSESPATFLFQTFKAVTFTGLSHIMLGRRDNEQWHIGGSFIEFLHFLDES